jgi:prevent-host-death family protein
MNTVSIHDAKTQLSRLVERAARGEAFIIAKAGKPMVKVVPLNQIESGTASRLGFMAGELTVPDDFDKMNSGEIAGMFTEHPA